MLTTMASFLQAAWEERWVRERLSGGSAEVVHCHMLFHLAHPFIRGRKRLQVETALERLIDRHGDGNYLDCTLELRGS
jgi:hypothetical protein